MHVFVISTHIFTLDLLTADADSVHSLFSSIYILVFCDKVIFSIDSDNENENQSSFICGLHYNNNNN